MRAFCVIVLFFKKLIIDQLMGFKYSCTREKKVGWLELVL